MPSKSRQENYLMIDHRAGAGTKAVPGGALFETATISCSHCQKQVIVNPGRVRQRAYCPRCDHFICDECEVIRVASGGACKPFKQVIDEFLEQAHKGALIHG